jgi:voltage-gated potassium channel
VSPAARVLFALALLAVITAGGVAGYITIEGWPWIDALYMSVITLSTVGYGEPRELSDTGRLFTALYIVLGVGTAVYLLSAIAGVIVEGRLRALVARGFQLRRIGRMQDHVIVAGYGRFGRVVVSELLEENCELVVIEKDPGLESELEARGVPFVLGSGVHDEILLRAGIERARALVVATGSEAENVFITLAARELAPSLRVHARADSDSGERRLQRAGASRVISPFQMGGMRVAASIVRPAVVDFVELSTPRRGEEVDLEEVRVAAGSPLAGRDLASVEAGGGLQRVIAIKHGAQPIQLVPGGQEIVQPGDYLVVIGPRDDLNRLALQAQAEKP